MIDASISPAPRFAVWDRCGNFADCLITISEAPAAEGVTPDKSESDTFSGPVGSTESEKTEDAPILIPVHQDQGVRSVWSLFDLICTTGILVLAILSLNGGDVPKENAHKGTENIPVQDPSNSSADYRRTNRLGVWMLWILAALAVLLFVFTQPFVLHIRMFDWWSIAFVVLFAASFWIFSDLEDKEDNQSQRKEDA